MATPKAPKRAARMRPTHAGLIVHLPQDQARRLPRRVRRSQGVVALVRIAPGTSRTSGCPTLLILIPTNPLRRR